MRSLVGAVIAAILLGGGIATSGIALGRSGEMPKQDWLQACVTVSTVDGLKECVSRLLALQRSDDETRKLISLYAEGCTNKVPEKMRDCLAAISRSTASPADWARSPSSLSLDAAKSGATEAIWRSGCSTDKMTDQRDCLVSAELNPKGASIFYSIDKDTLVVSGERAIKAARIRIDKRPALAISPCVTGICLLRDFSRDGHMAQLRMGATLLVDYEAVAGGATQPVEIPLSGFEAALQEAQSSMKK